MLLGGKLDIKTGQYYIPALDEDERRPPRNKWEIPEIVEDIDSIVTADYDDVNKFEARGFMYSWELRHPDLENLQWSTFFNMCRYESLDYDEY